MIMPPHTPLLSFEPCTSCATLMSSSLPWGLSSLQSFWNVQKLFLKRGKEVRLRGGLTWQGRVRVPFLGEPPHVHGAG